MSPKEFLEIIHEHYPELDPPFMGEDSLGDPFNSELVTPEIQRATFLPPDGIMIDPEHVAIDPDMKLGASTDPLDPYLAHMPGLSSVLLEALATGKKPLADFSIFLVHHLTAEVLGLIAALRKLGCRDLVTVFVGYNAQAAQAYGPDLNQLPDDEFQYYVLELFKNETEEQVVYKIDRTFIQTRRPSAFPFDALDHSFASENMNFLQAMLCLSVYNFLELLAQAKDENRQVLIIEDGAYIAPVLNEIQSEDLSIQEMRKRYFTPADPQVDQRLPTAFREASASVLGTVEHTRNGYNRMYQVQANQGGSLVAPTMTIAVSHLKTQLESRTVAASIINAIESVLYSQGYVLDRRHIHIIGSRGHIGRYLMKSLSRRLEDPTSELSGCDLKVSSGPAQDLLPPWHPQPDDSAVPDCLERSSYRDLPEEVRLNMDLVIGVTGGPTPNHPTLEAEDLEEWLLSGHKRDLFIASGSTKTAEFPDLLQWGDKILSLGDQLTIGGCPARVERSVIVNRLTKRDYGSKYAFSILHDDGYWYPKNIYFLHELMPINFLYYGVPTEVIEEVLAQLLSVSLKLTKEQNLPAKLYAVDYDQIATEGIYKAQGLDDASFYPLPNDFMKTVRSDRESR